MPKPLILLLLLLLGVYFLNGCHAQPVEFQLIQSHDIPLEETDTVEVNNCGNVLERPYIHWYGDTHGSAEVANLKPNGGEPFTSIRHRMAEAYGKQAQPLFFLSVPANTHRLYTFALDTTRYRGEVIGAVITANKERPATPAFYSYYVRRNAQLREHEDIPCP